MWSNGLTVSFGLLRWVTGRCPIWLVGRLSNSRPSWQSTFCVDTKGLPKRAMIRLATETPLILESRMAENGVIFSDGMEKDFLEFNSGTQAVIGIGERKGILIQ